jgi:hypothetical protein
MPSIHKMVRNIDLAEAIIFYGQESLFQDEANFQPGVDNLIQESLRDETAVVAILEADDTAATKMSEEHQALLKSNRGAIQVRWATQPAPNPRDLWESIHEILVQPKGFGGSSGFGTKAADPERNPLPKHCVVLCHTEDQCRAARYTGMRVLCLTDNGLADGIMFDGSWESIYVDDIATPGSFWLNPPHPRDDEGNKVDPESLMLEIENDDDDDDDTISGRQDKGDEAELSDDQLAAILADMDPL